LLEDLNQRRQRIQEAQSQGQAILASIATDLWCAICKVLECQVNKAFGRKRGDGVSRGCKKKLADFLVMTDEKGTKFAPEHPHRTGRLEQKAMKATSGVSSTYYERKDGNAHFQSLSQ